MVLTQRFSCVSRLFLVISRNVYFDHHIQMGFHIYRHKMQLSSVRLRKQEKNFSKNLSARVLGENSFLVKHYGSWTVSILTRNPCSITGPGHSFMFNSTCPGPGWPMSGLSWEQFWNSWLGFVFWISRPKRKVLLQGSSRFLVSLQNNLSTNMQHYYTLLSQGFLSFAIIFLDRNQLAASSIVST